MEGTSPPILGAYIPVDRRHALASGRQIPSSVTGSVLFADISGFTKLTGDLTRELGDQRGADEITRYLNMIYGALIAEIHQYRGAVISFAGDAITCWFDEDEGLRAMTAGTGMQAATSILVRTHQLAIGIKIVIASGPAFRHVVGDPGIQLMDLLAGDTVSRVTSAEKLAKPGDLLVSAEIADRYRSILSCGISQSAKNGDQFMLVTTIAGEITPSPWQGEIHLPEEIMSDWMLAPVFEKIRHGEERFLAELRLTVCLFMKFEGIDYDRDPGSGDKINRFICWIQECAGRHDGHLLQVIIGDKGDYLYIGFGALAAHEDDPSRAIAAARMLRQPPESLSFISDIQIGITYGRMLAGPYGSSDRRTYSMLGAGANLAARLMERAQPGQILLTERVAIAAQKHFLFNPLGADRFKGFEQAVPVFELTGTGNPARHIQLYQTPLVGRTAELEQLLEYAREVGSGGHNGMILLQGEGGIGKSRLLSEFLQKTSGQDITVLNGFGYAIENSSPYFVMRELFSQLFRADQCTTAALLHNVSSLVLDVNPEWERLMPLLSEIIPVNLPDNELTAQMYGEVRAGNLHALLIGILRKKAASGAFIILLDDAHWVDSASWALLRELMDAIPALGLILSQRPFTSDPPGDYLRLIRDLSHTEIHLTNFSRKDIEKLVCQVVGVAGLPSEVLSLIYEKASGQPFFSEELAYALVASGMLVVEDGVCRLRQDLHDLEDVILPDTIQSAITSRLDRMTPQQQLTLKVASIIGRMFMLRAVGGIHPITMSIPVLRQQMDAMTSINLIAVQVVEPDSAYSFKQNIIHEVAYNMLSFNQRHELHRSAASWYEETYAGSLPLHYSTLGYHWQQAEVYAKAAGYLEKAAFDAMSKGAYRDGITFIQHTLSMERQAGITDARKAALLIEMGIAHFKTGELEQATRELKTGIRTLRHYAPSSPAALGFNLLRQVSRQFVFRIRSKPAPPPLESERKIRLILSRAYEYLAQSYFHHNKLFFSLDASLSGLNAAESAGPSAQLARAYASLCINTAAMPFPGLSDEYARLAQLLLTDQVSLNDHGRILELIAVARSGKGRWAEIEQLCTEALVMANEIGDRFLMMENTCILAACLLPQGKLAESVRLREELYEIGVQDKVELVQGWALLQRAEISLMNNDFQQAHELLADAARVEHALGQPDRLWLHGLQAATNTRMNDPDAALESAGRTLTLARQSLPTSFFVLEGYAGMVTAFMALLATRPRNRALRKQTGQAFRAFGAYAGSFPIGQPRLLFCRGELARLGGKDKKAVKLWRAALARAEALGMVYESARCRKALAEF